MSIGVRILNHFREGCCQIEMGRSTDDLRQVDFQPHKLTQVIINCERSLGVGLQEPNKITTGPSTYNCFLVHCNERLSRELVRMKNNIFNCAYEMRMWNYWYTVFRIVKTRNIEY